MRAKKFWQIFIPVLALLIGGALGAYMNRARMLKIINYPTVNTMPDSTTVKIDSTNLPIVFVNTQGNTIERKEFVAAYVKIVDNGKDGLNYGDTLVYPNQKVDYEGYMAIKYRGNATWWTTNKKSYAIRALDKPIGGKKKKSQLLGMRKGKKWALKAGAMDKSMIRDALTFELARPYMDFVPQTRFCEVIIDGVYHGVYSMEEQITADRLKLEKPGNEGNELTGGYLFQISGHPKDNGMLSKHFKIKYSQEYPDSDKLSHVQKKYLCEYINKVEKSFLSGDSLIFKHHIDMLSMIDYQLSSEFSLNGADAYILSTFIYKYRDDKDTKFKFSLWDFDVAYGNDSRTHFSRPNTWVYEFMNGWWKEAMKMPLYADNVKSRWRQYRNEGYTETCIDHIIDSLANVLTICGAEKRNADAWNSWNITEWKSEIRTQKYLSSSYEDEIAYLKDWISRRLKWMDKELLGEE